MSAQYSSDSERVLYLEQIDIETNKRTKLNFKLQKDNNDVEMRRKEGTSSWIPSRSLEIVDGSKITINARSKFVPFGKFDALVEISGEEAMRAFWDSKESLSCSVTFDQAPFTVTFHFRPSHTSETMRTAVENLQTAMKGYKSLLNGSTEQRIIKFGGVVAEMSPFATLAFGVAKGTFAILKEQRKYDENVSDLASGIDGIVPFAERVLEGVLYEEELLDRAVRRLYDLIGDTADFVIDYAKRGPATRALRSTTSPKDHDKIKTLHGDFLKLKEEFDRAVDVAALTLARRTEELRLLEKLKPVETNYDEVRSCMEGTRGAVLDDIFKWAITPRDGNTQPSSSNIFWLSGMPGIGKTSVANSLCDRLCGSGNIGGSFFCEHDKPDLREPKRVLPTLIAKLVQMWGPFRKLVAQALVNKPQINPESTRGELLLEPLRLLKIHPPRPFVLVIDALDECGQPSSREQLLNCLIEACSLVHWLKIVVTSRPERDIESFFKAHHAAYRDLDKEDLNGEDIHRFTVTRMAAVAKHRNRAADWPGPKRIRKIVKRSGGLFMFVDTLSRLVDAPEPEPVLDQVLSGRSQGADNPLHDLYSMAITSRISKPTQAFHSILRAIIAVSANRPLCDKTLAELLSLDPQVVREWVDELSSLLYRDDSEKGGIRVRHLSILEFLLGSNCPTEFRVDLKLANAELAACCLRNMGRQLEFNICELETSYLPNSDIQDLNERVERKISVALQYSCMHWCGHLCYDDDPVSEDIIRLLDDFFAESQVLYWLEVLSLLGKVRQAILALDLIRGCIKKFEERHQCVVEDAFRFVVAFSTPISTSTPHLYISALAFMPVECSIWKCASMSFPGILNVRKGRMKYWPGFSGIWRGHGDKVLSIAYSPDGGNVVSGSYDNTVRIWDVKTGTAGSGPLKGHTSHVWSVAYSPDSRHFVSGSHDWTVRIWEAHTGTPVSAALKAHTGSVLSVAYSPNGRNVVSGSHDTTIRIWDAQTGTQVGEPLNGHTGWVRSVAYSPDGFHIVSGSYDTTIRIWDAKTGAPVGEPLNGHTGWVRSVAYSPDGCHIVSGSYDKTIRIWNAQTGAVVGKPIEGHSGSVLSVAYSPDSRNIVSGSCDNMIRIWDAKTGTLVGEPLNGHTRWVRSVAYSPDGRHIVSGSYDNTIRLWDAQKGALVSDSLGGPTGSVHSIAYSPHHRNAVAGPGDNMIRTGDTQIGAAAGESLKGNNDYVRSVAYSPDGRNIVSGSKDKTIRIWDSQTGTAVGKPLEGHTDWVRSVAYSPDGRNIVSGSNDKSIRIWDSQTGTAVGKPLEGHTGWVRSVAYSPDGRNIVSGSNDKSIRIWEAQTGILVGEPLEGHNSTVYSVAYSPDGRSVLSGSYDRTTRIWDAQNSTGADVRGVDRDSSNPSNCDPLNAYSGRFIPKKCISSDGWVCDGYRLLFWVPEEYRHGLASRLAMTISHTTGQSPVRIDFTHFQCGTSWTNVRRRNSGGQL